MRKIIYYVATSLDGFIAGRDNDVSLFASDGEIVDQYLYDLQSFDTVIMGRNTYEFGYQYGLKPGDPAYPHMEHYIFSNSLSFDSQSDQVTVLPRDIEKLKALKSEVGSDIYLCGGGTFAGWLLENGMIDEVKLKVNPIILGDGVKLFGDQRASCKLRVMYNQTFDDGFQIITYQVI
ncbi:dihydrofolate reductase family protein [Ekhidna sp.]|uniref:dihydrofolate reductase family protein n=1 Tax=Ekhidna sp. TaxID=2608089 RepID=UPI0035197046